MTDSKSPSEDYRTRIPPSLDRSQSPLAWLGRIAGLVSLLLLVILRLLNPAWVEELSLYSFDLQQQIAPRSYDSLLRVRIVGIDDRSLARYGQWPWPRTLMARLVSKIAMQDPQMLGVDIILSEPDRYSPKNLAHLLPQLPPPLASQLDSMPDNEVLLAQAFEKVPTVLGVGTTDDPALAPTAPVRITIVRQAGRNPKPYLHQYPYLLSSLPELARAARGSGSLIANPGRDGITRSVPMFIVVGGNLVPTLALEMLRVGVSLGSVGIVTGRHGIEAARLSDVSFPTDVHGHAFPYFSKSYEGRYISAADLLDGTRPPAELHGDFVLLGLTSQASADFRQTPLGLMAGVEVHAQLLESMLTHSLLRRPHFWERMEVVLVIVTGLLMIFALPYSRPSMATIGFVAMAVTVLAATFACFVWLKVLFGGVYAVLSSSFLFGVMLVWNLISTEAGRRRLAAELEHRRQLEARIDGELSAARSLQMGLLPHKFLGPPDRDDVDVFATIEPARMVGGDFYDFLLLDSRRLSFAIADVSGKGVPAALFMAMAKEILRSAISKHEDALDLAFAEASTKISAASAEMVDEGADMMFVTAFAGILDLTSGQLAYVNAGHDPPFVLRADAEPQELSGAGGPPLGTVDRLICPVERLSLQAGDLLLLYTDGATESENKDHGFYGMARLRSLLASSREATARGLVELVRADIRRFATDADQADDITLLALTWHGHSPNGR
jgi:adenylate cyclase